MEQWIAFKSQLFVFQDPPPSGGAARERPQEGWGGRDDSGELTPFIMAYEQSRADGISERLLFRINHTG